MTPWSGVLQKLIVTRGLKKFSDFMEPKGLLLCSQEPTIEHYYVLGECNPHPPALSFNVVLLSTTVCQGGAFH